MKKKDVTKKGLSKKDYKFFESLLLEERKNLLKNLMNINTSDLSEENVGTGEDISDYAEKGTDAFDVQIALTLASEESRQLQEIDEALERLKNNTYGICEMCKEPIPRKRLEALPHARFCVQCQSEFEKQQESPY